MACRVGTACTMLIGHLQGLKDAPEAQRLKNALVWLLTGSGAQAALAAGTGGATEPGALDALEAQLHAGTLCFWAEGHLVLPTIYSAQPVAEWLAAMMAAVQRLQATGGASGAARGALWGCGVESD